MIIGKDYTGVVVCFLCHDGNKNFVFGKRTNQVRDFAGHWDAGGGKLEFGEGLEEAIDRELREEFGCSGKIEKNLPPIARYYPQTKMHWVILRWVIKVDRNQVKNNEPRSIEEIGWFKLDDLPKPIHPGILEDLKIYQTYLQEYI